MNEYELIGWIRPNTLLITPQHQSVDFKVLFKRLNEFVIYNDGEKSLNANEYFIENIQQFQIGVSDDYYKVLYHHYSKIYIYNGLLAYTKNGNNCNMAQLTKLGYEYYNYLIHEE